MLEARGEKLKTATIPLKLMRFVEPPARIELATC
jgi:hypothetical protein